MSSDIKALKSAVKTKLADASLVKVKKWLSAEPHPNAHPALCFGWVEWSGGPSTLESTTTDKEVNSFLVAIVVKDPDADRAEDAVLDLLAAALVRLKLDKTFGGNCTSSDIVNRQKEKYFDGRMTVAAVGITLQTWKWVNA